MELPFCEACERNKESILYILKESFSDCTEVFEIGSGTGQHAVHCGTHLPHVTWQPTELPEYLEWLQVRLDREAPENVKNPLLLDVFKEDWNYGPVDAVFMANTLHIMSWKAVHAAFVGIGRVLRTPGLLCVYGPFNYQCQYTSQGNAAYDRYLKASVPLGGIRDFESVNELAAQQGLALIGDHDMPANNRILMWKRE